MGNTDWEIARKNIGKELQHRIDEAQESGATIVSIDEGLGKLRRDLSNVETATTRGNGPDAMHEAIKLAATALRLADAVCNEEVRKRSKLSN